MTPLLCGHMAETTWMNSSDTLTAKEAVSNSPWNWKIKDRYHFWMFWSRGDEGVTTQVYKKTTHTNWYVNFKSHHHPRIKAGVLWNVWHTERRKSVIRVHYSQSLTTFRKRSRTMTIQNSRCIKQQSQRKGSGDEADGSEEVTDLENTTKILCLPCVQGLSECIERSCKLLDIKFAFKSRRTHCKLLTGVKNPITHEKKKGVVYKVDCSCGNTYIGETGITLDARLKEHQRAVKVNNRSNGTAVHVNNTAHGTALR